MSSLPKLIMRMPLAALLYLSACILVFPLFFWPQATRIEKWDPNTIMYFVVWILHFLYGGFLVVRSWLIHSPQSHDRSEFFLFVTGVGFLFSYIFAANANLDYVQWFIRSGGNLQLALDSRTERLVAFIRYGPFFITGILLYIKNAAQRQPDPWRFVKVLFSAAVTTVSFPSFVHLDGFGVLGWIAQIPFWVVIFSSNRRGIVFYGTVYGTFTSVLINFWLGTFSLVSLQVIILIQGTFYLLFSIVMAPLVWEVWKPLRFLLAASLWTLFEYARSIGFLGYPWGLLGATQYPFPVVLQLASVTGVWGLSFLVVLVNTSLAELWIQKKKRLETPKRGIVFSMVVGGMSLIYGGSILSCSYASDKETDSTVNIALIQQNTDPRKADYWRTFEILRSLTDKALQDPEKGPSIDLVVWAETAFVPNIRRWSQYDPEKFSLARLVLEFLEYQKTMGTYLITGNDDYEVVSSMGGIEVRENFNAAVFLSPQGQILSVYRKNKLVPFTEHFPFEEELPWVYNALQSFDVHFWEPGTELTVFQHPKFRFSTPICFENIFPDLVRNFIRNGAEIIVNISNDYWSLTPVQGTQHATHALIRAVENRRPMVRSTTSGLTLYVDPWGRIQDTLPLYEEGFLIAEVGMPANPAQAWGTTVYTKLGDWFPWMCLALIVLLMGLSRLRPRRPSSSITLG